VLNFLILNISPSPITWFVAPILHIQRLFSGCSTSQSTKIISSSFENSGFNKISFGISP
jgi:hypothetical protein